MGLRIYMSGPHWGLSDKESACQGRRHGFDPSFGKISHALEQLKPECHNYWACFLEPGSLNYWSLQTPEPVLHKRSHRTTTGEQPLLTSTREKPTRNRVPAQPTNTLKHYFKTRCDELDLLKKAMSNDGIISNFFKKEIIASWDCSFKQLVAYTNGLLGLSP